MSGTQVSGSSGSPGGAVAWERGSQAFVVSGPMADWSSIVT